MDVIVPKIHIAGFRGQHVAEAEANQMNLLKIPSSLCGLTVCRPTQPTVAG